MTPLQSDFTVPFFVKSLEIKQRGCFIDFRSLECNLGGLPYDTL